MSPPVGPFHDPPDVPRASFDPLDRPVPYVPVPGLLVETPGVITFEAATVAPCGLHRFEQICDELFRPTDLWLPHAVAHQLTIREISVGARTLLVGSGALAGEVFCTRRPRRLAIPLDWPTIPPATKVRIVVESITHAELFVVPPFITGVRAR